MGVILTLIAGLVVWIVLWAIGAKSFDAFLITIVMLIVAAAAHIVGPTLPGNRDPDRPSCGPSAHRAVRGLRPFRRASWQLNSADHAACVESPPTYDS